MSGDLEERMGQLCDELQQALDAGQSIDIGKLAERFAIPEPDVHNALQALQAMQDVLGEDVASHAQELTPPQLSDDYEVLDELGRGGMGIVYRAHQKSLDRDLAVKVLRPGDLLFGDAIHRFEREAKSLARLRHRHIVSVHEVGKADGFVYFTMDLIDGCTLAERLENGAMPTTQAVKLLRQISSAMSYAHGKGVMHRDLKPGNILLDGNGDAFVCDFGLARELGGEAAATMTGQMLGTPAYMSPEQALGDRNRIGEQTDVYALGAILYECLAGNAPFAGLPLAQLMNAVIEKEPTPLRKRNARVPFDLQVITEKAMAKDPERRYATVQAFAEDLERFSIGKPILARRRSPIAHAWQLAQRHRSVLTGALAPLLVLVALAWAVVLPSVAREQSIQLGDQLYAEGNVDGALVAYTKAFATCDPDELSLRQRADYARALIDGAAHDVVHAPSLRMQRFERRTAEARRMLQGLDQPRSARELQQLDQVAFRDLERERLRLSPLLGNDVGSIVRATALPEDRDPNGTGAAASTLGALWQLGWGRARSWTAEQRAAALALLPLATDLPAHLREQLHRICDSADSGLTAYDYVDLDFLGRLVAIARDTARPLETRTLAAGLFHRCGWLPVGERRKRIDFDDTTPDGTTRRKGFYTSQVRTEADLTWLVRCWDRLRALPHQQQYRERLRMVAERLAAVPAEPQETYRDRIAGLQGWLYEHAGIVAPRRDDAEPFLAADGGDPTRSLLRALRWNIDPHEITPEAIFERIGSEGNDIHLHHLLEYRFGDGIRIPRIGSWDHQQILQRWEEALQRPSSLTRTVRIATFLFENGATTPELIGQRRLHLDPNHIEPWQLELRPHIPAITCSLSLRKTRPAAGLPEPTLHGRTQIYWSSDRVQLDCDVHLAGYAQLGRRFFQPDDSRVFEGQVGVVFASTDMTGNGSRRYDLFTLATICDQDDTESAWTTEQWRDAASRSIATIATLPAREIVPQCPHLAAAVLFPLPERRDELAQIDELVAEDDYASRTSGLRALARLHAGDPQVLSRDVRGDRNGEGYDSAPTWMRIAATTADDAIRQRAFEELGRMAIRGELAATLRRTIDAGLDAPAALRSRVAPSWLPSEEHGGLGTWTWLLLQAAGTFAGLWMVCRGRRRRIGALLLITAGTTFAVLSLQVDGVEWLPVGVGHAVLVTGIWTLLWRLHSGRSWALVAWGWTAIAVADSAGMQVQAYVMVGVLAVLSQLLLASRERNGQPILSVVASPDAARSARA